MSRKLIIVAALGITAAVTAWAQDRSASPAPAEERITAAANDCARSPAKRHDHTAERNYGPTAAKAQTQMPCAPAGDASPPVIKSKAKGHNHTTFHKTL